MRTALRTIVLAIREAWNPTTALFANGEVGVFYDCSDLTSMFQDSAGTTPVTAVEQPVGLILDKSKGLVLGAELVVNGGFDANITGWSDISSAGGAIAWNASGCIDLIYTTGVSSADAPVTTVIGKTYKVSVSKLGTSSVVNIGATRYGSGLYNQATSSADLVAYFTATTTTSYISIARVSAGTAKLDNISVRELPGTHAVQATSTKRPILKLIDGKYSLLFDGIDDSMSTGSIDFTSTDKMTVVAGVRKLSDAAAGAIVELSATPTASDPTARFSVTASVANLASYGFGVTTNSGGSGTFQTRVLTYTAPITNVVSAQFDSSLISGSGRAVSRINAAAPGSIEISFEQAGTGPAVKFGSFPIYIGSRGGTSLPFNGHLYSLIVRGAQSTDAQIVAAETYCNQKTGAY